MKEDADLNPLKPQDKLTTDDLTLAAYERMAETSMQLYKDLVEIMKDEGAPEFELQELEAHFKQAMDERHSVFLETKGDFSFPEFCAQRPDNVWLQFEQEFFTELVAEHAAGRVRTRKGGKSLTKLARERKAGKNLH